MAKQPLSINTNTPPTPSTASTEIGEEDGLMTPTSLTMPFPSAATSRAASPQRQKMSASEFASYAFFLIAVVVFAILHAKVSTRDSNASSSPVSTSLSLPRWKENAIPTPGKTYIIIALELPQSWAFIAPPSPDQVNHHKAITLVHGQLKLMDLKVANLCNGCWSWQCISKEGWLGFRNVASGTYLGHNGNLQVVANAAHCKAWEWFCVRRVPHVGGSGEKDTEIEGYVMLTRHWDSLRWVDVSISKQMWYLTGSDRAAVWGFIEVGEHDG
ncbi:hypothetical protein QBC40DRAFT_275141 [Triangularia verruculosa]|uniref:Uncharacterized protein n=1 Tax=Triangularia verruculosa TaxID=2587418 RepID=A0AAN6XMN8_9PEZI|nr:hypothetical protein QBC40DRAFT_275141 [Triangularia verruculosa]